MCVCVNNLHTNKGDNGLFIGKRFVGADSKTLCNGAGHTTRPDSFWKKSYFGRLRYVLVVQLSAGRCPVGLVKGKDGFCKSLAFSVSVRGCPKVTGGAAKSWWSNKTASHWKTAPVIFKSTFKKAFVKAVTILIQTVWKCKWWGGKKSGGRVDGPSRKKQLAVGQLLVFLLVSWPVPAFWHRGGGILLNTGICK